MSSEIALRVKNLHKCYLIYDRPQDRLKQSFFRGRRQYYREFWALKGISFEVKKGEAIGIIGRNGSGKSSLLQIVAGTLNQTSGEVQVNGQVAALLELGSGFNPEFTGRENVFLNGALFGLTRKEIKSHFAEILDFADIGNFIDQPIKTYSSGMVMRLAFAVQVFVPKEILVVDEALAVGDELFQRKCFAKIEEFCDQGGTLLFVSHASTAVVQLCDRTLLLHDGECVLSGPSHQVVNLYQKFLYSPRDRQAGLLQEMRQRPCVWPEIIGKEQDGERQGHGARKEKRTPLRPLYNPSLRPSHTILYEPRGVHIFDAEIVTVGGERVNLLVRGERYIWKYKVQFDQDCQQVRFGMLIKALQGLELGGATTAPLSKGLPCVCANTVMRIEFTFQANLVAGMYFLNAGVLGRVDGEESFLDRKVDLSVFKVLEEEDSLVTGLVDFQVVPQLFWNIAKTQRHAPSEDGGLEVGNGY